MNEDVNYVHRSSSSSSSSSKHAAGFSNPALMTAFDEDNDFVIYGNKKLDAHPSHKQHHTSRRVGNDSHRSSNVNVSTKAGPSSNRSGGAALRSTLVTFLGLALVAVLAFNEYGKYEKCQLHITKKITNAAFIIRSAPCVEDRQRYEEYMNCKAIQQEAELSPLPLIVSCWMRDGIIYEFLTSLYDIVLFRFAYGWTMQLVLCAGVIFLPFYLIRSYLSRNNNLHFIQQLHRLTRIGANNAADNARHVDRHRHGTLNYAVDANRDGILIEPVLSETEAQAQTTVR